MIHSSDSIALGAVTYRNFLLAWFWRMVGANGADLPRRCDSCLGHECSALWNAEGRNAGEVHRDEWDWSDKLRLSRNANSTPKGAHSSTESIIELSNVSVVHSGRAILDHVSWTVRAGERWAVVGPNGSGKTTLLSLLCGDHPQAYSNDVRLFGRQRGTGETIWDVKRNVGLVSPEFHLYFSEPLTGERTAATGFFDTVAARPRTEEQTARVHELFAAFGIAHLLDRPFRGLSTGEQRLVLLIRALVKRPPLLILDEPFQGFDTALVNRGRAWLDRELGADQTLLFVTHDLQELPECIDRILRLESGHIQQ